MTLPRSRECNLRRCGGCAAAAAARRRVGGGQARVEEDAGRAPQVHDGIAD